MITQEEIVRLALEGVRPYIVDPQKYRIEKAEIGLGDARSNYTVSLSFRDGHRVYLSFSEPVKEERTKGEPV